MLEEPSTTELQKLIKKQGQQIEESKLKIDRLEDTLRSLIVKFGEMVLERDKSTKESKSGIVIHNVNVGWPTSSN